MSPLLGPILAQLVTLGVSDRTEARYVVSGTTPGQQPQGVAVTKSPRFEGATYPRINLDFGWRHSPLNTTSLSLGYAPSFTVTPLDSADRELYVFQQANFLASHSRRYERTTLTLSQSLNVYEYNFQQQALGFPGVGLGGPSGPNAQPGAPPSAATPGSTPGTGSTVQPPPGTGAPGGVQFRAADRTVRVFTEATTVSFAQLFSQVLTGGADFSYTVAGSVYEVDRDIYPIIGTPRALFYANYRIARRDTLTSSLSVQYAGQPTGNNAIMTVANETWSHRFDQRTTTTLGGGLSVSRNSQPDGLVYWNVYPTFNAGINHVAPLGHGAVNFGANAYSAPALDPVRASFDPRLSLGVFAGYGLERFSLTLAANSAISFGGTANQGGLNTVFGSLIASYLVGTALSVDAGARIAYQTFNSQTTIPPGIAFFVGLTFGARAPLNH
ncbi:MAG: hypothetical protein WDO74_30695 [Pseudomonadota bacterium]